MQLEMLLPVYSDMNRQDSEIKIVSFMEYCDKSAKSDEAGDKNLPIHSF